MHLKPEYNLFHTKEEALADSSIKQLKVLSEQAGIKVDIVEIRQKLINILRLVKLPIIELPREIMICRARRNENGEIFTTEQELSINKTKKHLINLGRFNLKGQGVFYGTVRIQENKQTDPILNAIIETHQDLVNKNIYIKDSDYTVGVWNSKQSFFALNFVIHPRWLEYVDMADFFLYDSLKEIEESPTTVKNLSKKFIEFITDLASKEPNDTIYSITSVFFNLINEVEEFENSPIGILYPSCKADGKGTNLVISEKHFTPKMFQMTMVVAAKYLRPLEKSNECYVQYACEFTNVLNGKFKINYFAKNYVELQFEKMILKSKGK